MKPLNERRLIELAFGDLPAESEAHVAADPAAKQRLAEYRQMKTALSQLKDVPEHQLSTERMRQAILNRGVSRRRRFVWERVGYAAAACAIFFVAFGLARHLRAPGSPAVNIQNSGAVAKGADSPFDVNAGFDFSAPVSRADGRKSSHVLVRKSGALADNHESRHSALNFAEYHPTPSAGRRAHGPAKNVSRPVDDVTPDSSSLADNTQDSGVVVIEGASDSSTGLSNAKEVASTSAAVGG